MLRDVAGWAAICYLNASGGAPRGEEIAQMSAVVLDIEISWEKGRKRVDSDNAIGMCKAARDGIADVLWEGRDSHVTIGEVRQTRGEETTTFILRSLPSPASS